MGWFSRRLSNSKKEKAVAMVRHLQTMLAYQQLAMETYNDAIAAITGEIPHGAELTITNVNLFDTKRIAQNVIPEVARKIEIFQLMEIKHREAGVLVTDDLQEPYHEMTASIELMLKRARYQYYGFQQGLNSTQMVTSVRHLDREELVQVDRALKSLNKLIFNKIKLTTNEWLDIVHEAFNTVRASLNLTPLDKAAFGSRYARGINGEPVRFFKD